MELENINREVEAFYLGKLAKALSIFDLTDDFGCVDLKKVAEAKIELSQTFADKPFNISNLVDRFLMEKRLIEEKKLDYLENRERINVQKKAQLGNRVIELMAAKKREQASEKIVDYIKENNYIYTTRDDEKSEVWIYMNGIYVPQGKCFIKELVRELLGMAFTNQICNEVISKIEADTYIEHNDFFNTNYPEEIPVQNGILNVITRELSSFNPKKIFFSKMPVFYDPMKDCSVVEAFLEDVLSNVEDKLVFYELGGFCLLKEYKFEKAFMLVGNGRNGKGKSLELIKRVVGADNVFSLSLSSLQSDNADVSQLFGKLVNLAGDINNKDLQDTSLFKSLTGRDLVTSRRKYLKAITFENYAKFVFACNELPMVYDTSKGFWDRWVLLEFPYYFADKTEYENANDKTNWKIRDEDLINKISTPEQLSGLLNKFLDGLARLLKNRKFSSTKGSEDIKTMWIRKANSFMAFASDKIEESYEHKITKRELRKRYSSYCKEHKVPSKSDKVIKSVMQDMFGANDSYSTGDFGKQEWIWEGVTWKN